MNIILSILYAPLVFLSLRYFDIQSVSVVLFLLSSVWFVIALKKSLKETLYPSLYIFIALLAYFINDFFILKALPLLISISITSIIAFSYINENSLILYFAKRFSKQTISQKEEVYIHKSTLFWIGICLVNIGCHMSIFLQDNIQFWLLYSSIGWYFLFLLAGIIQFLHRKFVFLKELNE